MPRRKNAFSQLHKGTTQASIALGTVSPQKSWSEAEALPVNIVMAFGISFFCMLQHCDHFHWVPLLPPNGHRHAKGASSCLGSHPNR